jgi:hypothetical protein
LSEQRFIFSYFCRFDSAVREPARSNWAAALEYSVGAAAQAFSRATVTE